MLAFSDRKLNPIIYIYTFPELNKLTELKGNDVVTIPVTIALKHCFIHPVSEGVFLIRLEKQCDRKLSHDRMCGKQWKEFSTVLLLFRLKLGRNMTIQNRALLKGK